MSGSRHRGNELKVQFDDVLLSTTCHLVFDFFSLIHSKLTHSGTQKICRSFPRLCVTIHQNNFPPAILTSIFEVKLVPITLVIIIVPPSSCPLRERLSKHKRHCVESPDTQLSKDQSVVKRLVSVPRPQEQMVMWPQCDCLHECRRLRDMVTLRKGKTGVLPKSRCSLLGPP